MKTSVLVTPLMARMWSFTTSSRWWVSVQTTSTRRSKRPGRDDDVLDLGEVLERGGHRADVAGDRDGHHGLHREAERGGIGDSDHLHHAPVDEALHPLADGGLRQAHRGAELRVRRPPVDLQRPDDGLVRVVELGGGVGHQGLSRWLGIPAGTPRASATTGFTT